MLKDSSPCSPCPPPLGPSCTSKSRNHEIPDAQIHNKAVVARIMKIALPENAKIAKEAKECMQECVSEFIAFITSEGACIAFNSNQSLFYSFLFL